MTTIERLAEIYSLPITEVERWPDTVCDVLLRNADRRGWLVPVTA